MEDQRVNPNIPEGFAEFAERVRAEFQGEGCSELHEALDTGWLSTVMLWLDQNHQMEMKPEAVVDALENGRQQMVLEDAKRAVRLTALLEEFMSRFATPPSV